MNMVPRPPIMNSKFRKILEKIYDFFSNIHSQPVAYDVSRKNDIHGNLGKNDEIEAILEKHYLMNSMVPIVFHSLRMPSCVGTSQNFTQE